jgi:hypothetical protein
MGFFKRFTRPRAKLSLTTEKRELALGQELKGFVTLKVEEEFDVEAIIVSLRCWESIKKTRRHYQRGHYETDDMTGEKEWVEDKEWFEEYWDAEKLYSERLQVCNQMHINVGFNKQFPFLFKIPVSERETYHGADRKVEWLVSATMPVKGRRHIETNAYEILVGKPSVLLKEVVKEVVLIPCAYCGGLMPQTSIFCPNCGARRKS